MSSEITAGSRGIDSEHANTRGDRVLGPCVECRKVEVGRLQSFPHISSDIISTRVQRTDEGFLSFKHITHMHAHLHGGSGGWIGVSKRRLPGQAGEKWVLSRAVDANDDKQARPYFTEGKRDDERYHYGRRAPLFPRQRVRRVLLRSHCAWALLPLSTRTNFIPGYRLESH